MIKGAVFDADGTLLDSMGIWMSAGERYIRALGLVPEEGLSVKLYDMNLDEGSAYLKKEYRLSESAEAVKAGVLDIISRFYREEVQLKPGVGEFVSELAERNIPMVIATTGDRELLDSALYRLGIGQYFSRIFDCASLHTSKRQPDIYIRAAAHMQQSVEHIYVFEDALYALMTAKAAGFPTVAIADDSNKSQQKELIQQADYYLADFHDFAGFWERIKEK